MLTTRSPSASAPGKVGGGGPGPDLALDPVSLGLEPALPVGPGQPEAPLDLSGGIVPAARQKVRAATAFWLFQIYLWAVAQSPSRRGLEVLPRRIPEGKNLPSAEIGVDRESAVPHEARVY